jgi:hypothetical protein
VRFTAITILFLLTPLSFLILSCDGDTDGDEITSGGWQQVGGQVSPAGAESEDPAMLVIDSTPALGYRHQSFRTYLNVWNGTDWGTNKPDPSSNNTAGSYGARNFCASGSDIYMAYVHEGDGGASGAAFYNRVFAYRWNETGGWSAMNSGAEVSDPYFSEPSAHAYEVALACPVGGSPVAAWVEWDAPGAGYYDAWGASVTPTTVTRSSPLSRNNSAGSYATDVRIVGVAASGSTIYLAQYEQHHNDQYRTDLYVSSYNGSFTNLGGSLSADYDSNYLSGPSMVVLGSDLYITYSETAFGESTRHVYVKKYDGAWSTVGDGPVSAFSASDHYDSANPDLLVADGTLYVAWEESSQYEGYFIYVAYWNVAEGSWAIIGDKLNISQSNSSHDPSLAYSSSDSYLYIAFEEFTDGWPHIFVKKKSL